MRLREFVQRGEGVKKCEIFADVINGSPLSPPHSLFLAPLARSLRVTLAADGAADVVVRLPRAVLAHRAERQVELSVLELGRAAVPATRSALCE